MGVGAGLYMYIIVVQKFTFAISSPDEFLYLELLDQHGVVKCTFLVHLVCDDHVTHCIVH